MTIASTEPAEQSTKPTKLTPRERKTQRLQMRLDEIDGAIAGVRNKHAATVADANNRVETRAADLDVLEKRASFLLDGTIAGVNDRIAQLRAELTIAEMKLDRATTEHGETVIAQAEAKRLLDSEIEARATRLDEPNRHLTALQKDRDSVAYRLEQHLAREPHKALFIGSKP